MAAAASGLAHRPWRVTSRRCIHILFTALGFVSEPLVQHHRTGRGKSGRRQWLARTPIPAVTLCKKKSHDTLWHSIKVLFWQCRNLVTLHILRSMQQLP